MRPEGRHVERVVGSAVQLLSVQLLSEPLEVEFRGGRRYLGPRLPTPSPMTDGDEEYFGPGKEGPRRAR